MRRRHTWIILSICAGAAVVFALAPDRTSVGQEAPPVPVNVTLRDLPPVAVFVDSLPDNVEERGITAGVLGAHMISRLKEGGIEVVNLDPTVPTPGAPQLNAVVIMTLDETVNTVVCSIRMELIQAVRLERDADALVPAATWSISGIAVYGEDWRDAIVNDIIAYTGDFVYAYDLANGGEAGY